MICSWCPDAAERTRLEMIANGGKPISHGICPECKAKMNAERDDEPRRKPTREEKLQALADSGIDTWADYRGEK